MELNCHSLKGNTMYLVQYKANCADEFDVADHTCEWDEENDN